MKCRTKFSKQCYFLVPEAPRAVKALVMGQDSILVSWRPPAQPNGVVTHYNVYTQAQNAEPHPNKVFFILVFAAFLNLLAAIIEVI